MLFLAYIATDMRKEVVFAVATGIILGLVVAFGVWRINLALKSQSKGETATQDSQQKEQTSPTQLKITIASPQNFDVVGQEKITVSGITKADSHVVISTPKGDYLTTSRSDGSFQEKVSLESAVNRLTATAIDKDGTTTSQAITLVYSTKVKTPQATSGANANIEEKVQAKVTQALNKPKAYIGTVTDFTDSTIQIKTDTGEIMQISTKNDENISVVKTTPSTKTIKLVDIAIGDFIVAMGTKDVNDVLNAQRILVISPPETKNPSVYLAKVTNISSKEIDFTTTKGSKNLTAKLDKNTDLFTTQKDTKTTISKISDINIDSQIILVATGPTDNLDTQTIFVLQ